MYSLPSILCGGKVAFSIQRDMAEGISVGELNSPLQYGNDATKTSKDEARDDVTICGCLRLGH